MFSETETEVIKLLGFKTLSIKELTKEFYKTKHKPISGNNYIAGVVKRINAKCNYHRLAWFINGSGAGRAGKTVWRDKKLPRRV